MEPIIAGIYFQEDIVDGSLNAFLISLACYIPMILLKLKEEWFNSACDVVQVVLFVYLFVFSFVLVSMCPHYWELAFPVFSGIAAAILLGARYSRKKEMKKSVLACAVLNVIFGILSFYPVASDISDVAKGEKRSREEFLQRISEKTRRSRQPE